MNHILKCHDIVKTDFLRGANCALYDSSGRRYVDFESGIWSTVLGHGHPRINQAIRAQLDQVAHLGTRYPSILAEEAARGVLDIVGIEDGKCVFLSSGSEAVHFAILSARRTTGKPLCLTFANSYLLAYDLAGGKQTGEWLLLDWQDCAGTDGCRCLDGFPFALIGAFVFEPGGSGSGFVRFPPGEVVEQLAQRVRREGGLIVANEVTTGMGRTGKWFGFQHYDIAPDIVALGKGLGNGYPVSAVAMRGDIGNRLEQGGLQYAQSHQNDPLGCAVVKEVIATLREEKWIERGNAVGAHFLEGLQHLAARHSVVKEARGRGMLLGLELYPSDRLTVQAVYRSLQEEGFLVGYYPAGNLLRFDPALTIDRKDINQLLDCLDSILQRCNAKEEDMRSLP
jgi:acetylornithine/N-succinyldiaminopimelate aminotransferase